MTALAKDIAQLKQLSFRQKILLWSILIALFAFGFLLGAVYQQTRNLTQAVRTALPVKAQSSLVLAPAAKTVRVGDRLPLSIILAGRPAQAIDLVLRFDPQIFAVDKLTVSPHFPLVLQQKIADGAVALTASLNPDNPEATQAGKVADLILTALKATPAAVVEFDREKTTVANKGINILDRTLGGKYSIKNDK